MRVVVLTAAYPSPSEPERAVYIENITRALCGGTGGGLPAAGGGRGPVVTCVVAPRVRLTDPLRETRAGISIRRFPSGSGGRRLKEIAKPSLLLLGSYFAAGLAATLEEARRGSADVILCHWILPAGPIGAAASALLGLPLAVFAHGSDLNRYAPSSRLRSFLARRTLRRARLVLGASAELRRASVERFGAADARCLVLPMGVDGRLFPRSPPPAPEERAEAKRSLGADPARLLLLYVGDVIPEKGVPELLEAAGHLRGRGIELDLAVVGDGPLRDGLREAAADRRILLPGRVPQAELRAWYRAADLLVLPSHAEGTPVTVMEALASGLPVIATRVGGLPELVEDGATGWLVSPRDAPGLAAALEGVLRNPSVLEAARGRIAAGCPDLTADARAKELREALEGVLGNDAG